MQRFSALRVGFLIWLVWLIAVAIGLLVLPTHARAAFPGANGKIAFDSIQVVNPDGSGRTTLTSGGNPAWSPDGTKIAFARFLGGGTFRVYIANADGSSENGLTAVDNADAAQHPAWSPDGAKLAVDSRCTLTCDPPECEIYSINADGTQKTNLTNTPLPACEEHPSWSPNGAKIAYTKRGPDNIGYNGPCDVWVMNADGSQQTRLVDSTGFQQNPDIPACAYEPDWSPDGRKIAFTVNPCDEDNCNQIWVMNADGSGQRVLNGTLAQWHPAWSPDGSKIAAYEDNYWQSPPFVWGVEVMDADGGNKTVVVPGEGPDFGPLDWQPINPAPYSTPVGASPLGIAFVQAYEPCETNAANARHGPPLDFTSCSNPTPTSSTVRMGPNTVSIVRIVVCASNSSATFCNPASLAKPDVRFTASIRDVRCASVLPAGCTPGGDYNPNTSTGPYTEAGNGKMGAQPPCFPSGTSALDCIASADLTETAELPHATVGAVGTQFEGRGVRITDRRNGPSGNDAATMTNFGFPVPLDCIPTANSTQGSTCGVNTTANALVPGVVTNGDTAVWQIGQVELKDSGPDGVRGNSDDEVFATQGVFLP